MHGDLGDDDDDEKVAVTARKTKQPVTRNASAASNTLLPRPVASLVTFFTQSTSLSLRLGAFLGGYALDSARTTTLTGLELSRAVVEGILVRAGRDVVARSGDDHGRLEAETLLERSLATLHSTITGASFFASAGFHLSAVTLSSISAFSQNLLSTLDAILGSSESSRAIAAFITLIRREFRNSDTANGGEKLRVGDLLIGIVGFALLQRWGRRNTDREIRENGNEEVIWDVVLLDNGLRADVVGTQRAEYAGVAEDGDDTSERRPASFFAPDNSQDDESFAAIERRTGGGSSSATLGRLVPHVALPADQQHHLSDEGIRHYIVNQLPRGSQASIKTDTVTARTITVDLFDDDDFDIEPPPGTAMIEERFNHNPDVVSDNSTALGNQQPRHTVVFRTVLNQSQTADLRYEQRLSLDEHKSSDKNSTNRQHGKQADRPSSSKTTKSRDGTEDNTQGSGGHKSTTWAQSSPRRSSVTSVSASSSDGGTETPKGSFGRTSFSKITQKVMGNTEERLGNKMPLKKFSRGLVHPGVTSGSGKDAQGAKEEELPAHTSSTNTASKNPVLDVNTKTTTRSGAIKPSPPNSASKPLPCTPLAPANLERTPPNTAAVRPYHGPSEGDYFSVHAESREFYTAQTDAYSNPRKRRPSSPALTRTHVRSSSSLTRAKSDKDLPFLHDGSSRPTSPTAYRRDSSKSLVPSMYSIAATDSNTSLVLAARPSKSVFDDQATISALARDGHAPGLFPSNHLAENVQRFSRFSSASYGSYFLRVMGISTRGAQDWRKEGMDHHEHSSFSDHTGLPASTILLSSFVDPAGGSNSSGETAEGFPLVHYLSLDHDSKAVVLTLRGTWGFEDILTDMTCDYDDLYWMGRSWQVHKGMHSSARRLLEGGAGRVMATTKAALEQFPDYGVIFCGHSLGGGVAALLATLLSKPKEPDEAGPMFVTASNHTAANPLLLASKKGQTTQQQDQPAQFCLPAGRPIHVYAYGPPAVMSRSLRRATRGLVTTVVNGQDVVPTLSLGILHDLHSVSLAFKNDMAEAKSYVRSRVWDRITHTIINRFYIHQPPILIHAGDGVGEDSWAWTTLRSLRENLSANKLLPPGEVFVVETMRVLQRDAFTSDSYSTDGSPRLGRPATRVQLKYIRDVESRFREIRFGSGMFGDHSPARYEASLTVLARGVLTD